VIDFVVLLAAIDDRSLQALIATIQQLPAVVPALQAWLDHAARWEYDRRKGMNYPLQGPMAAISPEEVPEALAASALIAQCFRRDRDGMWRVHWSVVSWQSPSKKKAS